MIERSQGCNHMTCRCGHQFCYICGKDWKNNGHLCRGDDNNENYNNDDDDCCECFDECGCCGRVLKFILFLPFFIIVLVFIFIKYLFFIPFIIIFSILGGMTGYTIELIG